MTATSGLEHDSAAPTTERLAARCVFVVDIDRPTPSCLCSPCIFYSPRPLRTYNPVIEFSLSRNYYSRGHPNSVLPISTIVIVRNSSKASFTRSTTNKHCSVCKLSGQRYQGHVNDCWYLSKIEKLEMAKALQVTVEHDVKC